MQSVIAATVISLGLLSLSAQAAEAPPPTTSFSIGAGVAIVPEYAGGDDYRALPLIAVDYQHASGFFASSRRGLGYQTQAGPFGISAAIAYDGGRLDHRRDARFGSDALRGMGDIPSSLTANLGASYTLENGLTLGARAVLALRHREKGNHYEFTAQQPLLKNERDTINLFALASYADGKNMRTYYGVTAAQFLSTGQKFKPYAPSAGFDKLGLGINWNRKISEKWSVNSSLGVVQLIGDAADSPLTKRKTAPLFATTLNYAF